jgi:hypothetical protein
VAVPIFGMTTKTHPVLVVSFDHEAATDGLSTWLGIRPAEKHLINAAVFTDAREHVAVAFSSIGSLYGPEPCPQWDSQSANQPAIGAVVREALRAWQSYFRMVTTRL